MKVRLTSELCGLTAAILAFVVFYFLSVYGLGLADRGSLAVALMAAIATFEIHEIWRKNVQRRLQWSRFTAVMDSPGQQPTSLDSNRQISFFPAWQMMAFMPDALIRMGADGGALQIASVDRQYNVAIPIEMITQVEFDRGDGPPGKRHPGMSWRREWLGLPFAPTVYLGLTCTDEDGVYVYPLCFHPQEEHKACELYERVRAGMNTINRSLQPTLAADVFDDKLPPSFESAYLRPNILQRFWPDYRASGLRGWLNR